MFKAEDNMKKYGKSLVNAVPDEATKLLKVLCTDYRPQRLNERELQYSLTLLLVVTFILNPPKLLRLAWFDMKTMT